MGRYVPPEHEGIISGNKLHGKHALGARANKLSQGILTVRFEMPYPIWCTSCPKPTIIGQGVRFNAEKTKVGSYYSSPIYNFRMKHVACGGWIEIRTDPKNTAYVVTEGARKRDLGEAKVLDGDVKIMTEEEREKVRSNAFTALEGKVEDQLRAKEGNKRLEELVDLSEQRWEDPYEMNKKLRKDFRVGRKQREREEGMKMALQDKMGLDIELLPEHEDDVRRAGFVEYGNTDSSNDLAKIVSKPLFAEAEKSTVKDIRKIPRKLKKEALAHKRTDELVSEIRGNTRAAIDPFLSSPGAGKLGPKTLLLGIKRKRSTTELDTPRVASVGASLVDYDSD